MGKIRNVKSKLARFGSEFDSSRQLFGSRIAALGYINHVTGKLGEVYFKQLGDLTWQKLMKAIPCHPQKLSDNLQHAECAPIWVMWWQGLDVNTPAIVKACIRSIRAHAGSHPVHIVTKDNVAAFADIDPKVLKELDRGNISLALFSDIVRFALLYTHGGAWIDSTVYVTEMIPENVFSAPFYSIPVHQRNPPRNWAAYFIAGVKGNPLFKYMYDALDKLACAGKGVPEYFMIDVMLYEAYAHYPEFQRMIDSVPENNLGRFELSEQLQSTDEKPRLSADNYINKLTYKINYPTTVNGKETIYQRLLDGEF